MKITIFSEELRECLDAAGLSDCGENDTWNYWYQRLMNAYNESVERQIMTEQAENAKLRELLADAFEDMVAWQRVIACSNEWGYGRGCREQLFELRDAMRDLGVEVDFDGR